jgi:hypothetical protein
MIEQNCRCLRLERGVISACQAQFSVPFCAAVLQVGITTQEGFSDISAAAAWDFLGRVVSLSAQKLLAIFQGQSFLRGCAPSQPAW